MEFKLHPLQNRLIKKLITTTKLRFKELSLEGLESEHMNYHLKQLIDQGLVIKDANFYTLTNKGKDYSNLLDDEVNLPERQPKTSILIRAVRQNEKGDIEHLMTRRLRQPYLGKVGRITGKIRFGETITQASIRELYEETGLKAEILALEEIYHKQGVNSLGEYVQDVIFYTFFASKLSGNFIEKTEFQENFWVCKTELANTSKFDTYPDLIIQDRLKPKSLKVIEKIVPALGY